MCDRTEIQNIVRDSKYVDVTNSRLFLKQLVFPFIVVAWRGVKLCSYVYVPEERKWQDNCLRDVKYKPEV